MTSIADRAERRIAVDLDAIVHPERGRTWSCKIRDFCASGMLLEGAESNITGSLRDSGAEARLGDSLHIHFSVPGGDGSAPRNYRLTAEVKRVMDNALGVFFPDGMAMRAFQALEGYALAQGPLEEVGPSEKEGGGTLDPAAAKEVTAKVRRLAAKALPTLYKAFFDRAAEELIVMARDAGSNVRQNELFEALNAVEGGARDIARAAGREVLDHIANPRTTSVVAAKRQAADQQGGLDTLSLVDTDSFEDWLAVADIISKAENRFVDDLAVLCAQLGHVHGQWREKDVMPLGPAVLAATFDDAMLKLELARDVRLLLYGYFRDALMAFMRKLLPSLQKLLDASGHVPTSDALGSEAWKKARPKAAPTPPRPAAPKDEAPPPEQPPQPAEEGGAAPGITQEMAAFDPTDSGTWAPGTVSPRAPDPGATTQMFQAIGAEQREALAAAAAAAEAYGPVSRAPMGDMFGTARELMQLRRGLPGPDGLPSEMPLARDVLPAPESLYSDAEVRSALANLRREPFSAPTPGAGAQPSVSRRLADALATSVGDKQLPPDARDALEVVDDLIGTIRSDAIVPESVKGWMSGLEMTYGQLATENAEFLDTTATPLHPALQLLNELAELGNTADAGEGMDPVLREQVEGVLGRVREGYDGDEAVFEQALGEIQPLVERQRRAFQGNVRRVVRQSEGAARLVRARRSVVDAMERRLAEREVPEPVLELLNPGWRNLLVHSHLRHGPDSEEFQRQLEVVDEVVDVLQGGVGDAEGLVDEIKKGLEDISFEPGRRSQLLAELKSALTGAETTTVRVEAGATADVLGLKDVLPDTEPLPETDDEAEAEQWNHALDLARELEVGSWVSLDDESGRKRILTVAWIGEEHDAFTLVNRKGVKVRDLELKEFVQGIVEGDIEVLDEFDMPLMERASQNMLQNMHNQLAYQATHDALTGLVNRKEFERAVDQAVLVAEAQDAPALLVFMDLDQFKIINNTCGHDAGDELLRALVPSLRHELRGVRGQLARLGGDEFGILVERCDAEQSEVIVQELLESVQRFRFEWHEQSYTLTASIGYVPFGSDGRDAVTLLQQADAACYAAKDSGRNRAQIHELDDARMDERRGVMEWVARVDHVLSENRIRLTAQKIAPIRDPGNALPHYEILMTVLDEDDKPMGPVDFITAAETYDRMPAVDRWVVSNALNWMSLNIEHLDKVHGFSINLSGTSLNDPTFCDFVVKQLQLTRVPTNKVTFEITETAAFDSMDAANRFIARLRDLGCTFSLDDFGTGLASYSYLRNLDVDFVKIDGMFVKDLIDSPADFAVVKSVSEIAHFMGKQTVAEFVETTQILDALREIGVDYAQGWGVEKPRPLDTLFS